MAKRNELYKCSESGNIVEVLVGSESGVGSMQLLKENTTDAATEKHVPVVEKIAGGYRVTVGEVEHPMTEEHSIQWIEQSLRQMQQRFMHVNIVTCMVFGAQNKQKISN